MAATLRLENYDATTTFNLLSDLKVIQGSQRFNSRSGRVIETVRLAKFASFNSDVQSAVRDLEDMLVDMVQWHEDVLLAESVWVRRAIDTETAKRALLHSFEFQQIDSEVIGALLEWEPAAVYELAITRDRYETVASSSASSLTNADFIGGMWDISGTISGGATAARIGAMRFRTQQDIGRFWAGIRRVRNGFANFQPILEAENGSSVDAGTTSSADASASPGSGTSKFTTNFSTGEGAGMAHRLNLKPLVEFPTAADAEDLVGRYHVIGRFHTGTSTGEFTVKMVVGFASSVYGSTANQIHYEPQHLAPGHTNWFLAPLGTIDIPSGGLRQIVIDNLTIADVVHDMEIRLWAERISASGQLDWDCLILIPADHSILVQGIEYSASADDDVYVFTTEDGQLAAYVHDGSLVVERPSVGDIGTNPWGYPEDGGLLVVAAERIGNSNWGDVFDEFHIDELYKRFITYHD